MFGRGFYILGPKWEDKTLDITDVSILSGLKEHLLSHWNLFKV